VKSFGSRWSEISCGFRLLFLFSIFLALTSRASGGTGQLTVSPSTINFGSVPVGSSLTQSVTLGNSGGSKLTVTQATLSGTDFAVSGLSYPVTLAGGQTVSCYVTFTPRSAGTESASVSISFTTQTSNGKGHYGLLSSNSTTVTLPVSGTGSTSGQLTTSPTSLGFGSVQVGNSQTLGETLSNSGAASLTISAVSATGSGFNASGVSLPITLAVGQSVSFTVTFSPASGGSVSGNLAVTSDASNPTLNVPLSGTGTSPGQLTTNPTSLSFGNVTTGSSSTLAGTLTNSGGSSLTISQITPSGTGFSLSGINLPLTLAAAQSASFNVMFAPQSAGSVTGSLAITSNGSNPALSVSLSGTGTLPGQLTVAPSTLNFGNVTDGTTQNQTGTLSASNAPVTVSSLGVSGSQFSVTGLSLPVTIAAGNSVSFQVTFAPQTTGAASANVTFVGNASNSPTVQSVTGSGIAPQHSVTLTWNASTSSNVAGYNIYRGTVATGPYTQINSALDTMTGDTDSTVQGGQTYYYVVTAVDSTGAESSYSNQSQAVVPYP
jgi:hypothetical protein